MIDSEISVESFEGIRAMAKTALAEPSIREEWASQNSTWEAITRRLELNPDLSLLQLANNLSACTPAGETAFGTKFCDQLLEYHDVNPDFDRLRWQILSNLSVGSPKNTTTLAEKLQSDTRPYHFHNDDRVSRALLIFTKILVDNSTGPNHLNAFLSSVLDYMLPQVTLWMSEESQNNLLISLATQLARVLLLKNYIVDICSHLVEANTDNLLTMLKLVDGIVTSIPSNYWKEPAASDLVIKLYLHLLTQYCTHLVPFMQNSQRNPNVMLLWNFVCVLLDTIVSILPLAEDSVRDQYRAQLLPTLIEVLKNAKLLPQKSKLDLNNTTINYEDLPFLRSKTLALIAILVQHNHGAQELMRESGGLGAVLECCVIDGNNPFMKESAIVCIRYLLEQNKGNQDFVASMEAKKTVNPEVLEQSGYEVEMVDGKIALKRKQ